MDSRKADIYQTIEELEVMLGRVKIAEGIDIQRMKLLESRVNMGMIRVYRGQYLKVWRLIEEIKAICLVNGII